MAETHVMYNGQRLIPAPLVTINKEYERSGDGTKIGVNFTLTISGTLLAYKGSPDSSGVFWTNTGYPSDEVIVSDSRLSAIERKIDAVRDLFSEDGHQLEFQSADGKAPIKCNPIIQSINFPEGRWHDTVDYSIVVRTDKLYGSPNVGASEEDLEFAISSASESWSLQANEQPQGVSLSLGAGSSPPSANDSRTYTLVHTINATGKITYDSAGTLTQEAWKNARAFVDSRDGYDASAITQSLLPIGPSDSPPPEEVAGAPYNHIRSINYDEIAGTYSLTETWTIANQKYLEQYTVTTTQAADTGVIRVGINGNVTGLYQRSADSVTDTVTGYENADTAWTAIESLLITRSQSYSGQILNVVPLTATVGRNPAAGVISYTYEYDNRPSNLITGSRSESITVTNNWDVDVFAEQLVIGRTLGPVLQSIGTHTALKRSLNIEVVFNRVEGVSGVITDIPAIYGGPGTTAMSDLQTVVDGANPLTYGLTAFVSSQNDNWNPLTGRYSYNVEWTYENTGTTTAGLKINA